VKRLIFCFDGTWNRLDAPYATNVVITAESVLPFGTNGVVQSIFYDEGVGTQKYEKIVGGLFGSGMVENLGDAYRFLIFNYTPGDEIYIFGFSRGAFTARSFAGLLATCGILRRRDAAKVTEAIRLYQRREPESPAYTEEVMRFRRDYSPHVSVSDEEEAWRLRNMPDYVAETCTRLYVTYLGVWDTVGALGVPARYRILNIFERRYRFHDTSLSSFVKSARHAVAINERRKDFEPTLWDNVPAMNKAAGAKDEAVDAPYQQKWFPGVHGAVGGGGERRGLSDQALNWILDGARNMGLEFDVAPHSRIYELLPNYADFLANSPPPKRPGLVDMIMSLVARADRDPGPTELFEVSVSARRRWLESPERLKDKCEYRPPTLARVADKLSALDPKELGVGTGRPDLAVGSFDLYQVKRDDTLSAIALKVYNDWSAWPRLFAANVDQLEDADHIYPGQMLKIPRP
jgi:uncharacterized protein (DUF2235 family)